MSAKERRIFRFQQAGLFFVFLLVAALAAAPIALSASASADTVGSQQTTTAAYTAESGTGASQANSAAAAQMYGMQTMPKKAVVAEDAGTLAFQVVMAVVAAGLVLHFAFKQSDMPSDRS